ncbi:MAG: hypothetical protein ABFS46_05410 [Myxococcota bacterium]
MQVPDRRESECLVCGFSEIRTDEVVERTVMLLGWCPRCDHRFTLPEPRSRPAALHAPPRLRVEAA